MTDEVILDSREVFQSHQLSAFGHYMEQRIAVAESIKELEEEKKRLDSEIKALMEEYGAVKVSYEGRSVSIVKGSRSNLSKEKLLLAGVPATTILSCTDTTHYDYVLVGKAKA
jgi:uncharacterized protein (UPF0335 family)